MSSACPARGCNGTQPQGVTLCRPCWYTLPKPLRSKLWRAVGTPELDDVKRECVERAEQNISKSNRQGALA